MKKTIKQKTLAVIKHMGIDLTSVFIACIPLIFALCIVSITCRAENPSPDMIGLSAVLAGLLVAMWAITVGIEIKVAIDSARANGWR